jgi:hypothetical protein
VEENATRTMEVKTYTKFWSKELKVEDYKENWSIDGKDGSIKDNF